MVALPPAKGGASMPTTSDRGLLEGLHVLIVEDDYLQADGLCLCVTNAGAVVLGPAGKIDQAVALINMNGVDVAVVNINLGDGPSFEVAGHLLRSKLPFVFVTGYNCRTLPQDFRHVLCLGKPYSEDHLIRSLANA